jgi:hypothetical protein
MALPLTAASPVPLVVATLAHPDPDQVVAAAHIIRGHCQDDDAPRVTYTEHGAIPALLSALTHHRAHAGVQESAFWALRFIGKADKLDNPVCIRTLCLSCHREIALDYTLDQSLHNEFTTQIDVFNSYSGCRKLYPRREELLRRWRRSTHILPIQGCWQRPVPR